MAFTYNMLSIAQKEVFSFGFALVKRLVQKKNLCWIGNFTKGFFINRNVIVYSSWNSTAWNFVLINLPFT